MIKNVIFDITRVLLKFDRVKLLSSYYQGEDFDFLMENLFLGWEGMDEDSISVEDYQKLVLSRLPEKYHALAVDLLNNWENSMTFTDGICDYLKELKEKGYKLYILSNMTRHFIKNAYKFDDGFKYFDGIVYSAPIKLLKPDVRIYQYICNEYNLKPEECLFVDDLKENLAGAARLSIKTFWFQNNLDELKKFINSLNP